MSHSRASNFTPICFDMNIGSALGLEGESITVSSIKISSKSISKLFVKSDDVEEGDNAVDFVRTSKESGVFRFNVELDDAASTVLASQLIDYLSANNVEQVYIVAALHLTSYV